MDDKLSLPRHTNQVRGLAQYALDMLAGKYPPPAPEVLRQVNRFHWDSVACGVSAIACRTNAPMVLRAEAEEYSVPSYKEGTPCFGSRNPVMPEKAILANCSAVREWDANGTNFGYNPNQGAIQGEFGHNDYYPVAVAAAQLRGLDGRQTLLGMLILDEIRGRLAEVFSLKTHKIDHVVHGAIASAVVFGAMLGASVDQIESAVGQLLAHYIPFRAIRAGKQLSDSKGASAAVSAEAAVVSMRRAMRGFMGPADIFRNPEAIFCLYEKPSLPGQSPFDLTLSTSGEDFAVMGMHFKLGLYEHQSAGAIQGVIDLLEKHPALLENEKHLKRIRVLIYQPAFGIIGDPAKKDPHTRQSADHSMVYIIATLLRKALESRQTTWRDLMLMPEDYNEKSLFNPSTRRLMEKIDFEHGGSDYDQRYPDGIPTTVEIEHSSLGHLTSGLVMYPQGHARNKGGQLEELLQHKFQCLASLGVKDASTLDRRFSRLEEKRADEIASLYDFEILDHEGY